MKFRSLIIAAFLFLGSLSFSLPAEAYGILKGSLTDARGQGVPSAKVSIMKMQIAAATTVTDNSGIYQIAGITAGTYKVIYSIGNFRDSAMNVMIRDGRTTVLHLKLRMEPLNKKMIPVVTRRPQSSPMVKEERESIAYDKSTSDAGYYNRMGSGIAAAPAGMTAQYFNPSTEEYKKDPENDFKLTSMSPLSTVSVDVDRAAYSNVRRFINLGQKPPADAVRIEEMINYFDYNYPQPKGDAPVAITTEVTACPWNPQNKLLHIGLQARKINTANLPPSNLVFLIDVSGSMGEVNKLPLLKSSFKLLVENLRENDHVAIVVYAGNAGLVLPPTRGTNKTMIIDALEKLEAGGSTAGGQGIELAYKTAEEHFIKGGNNRIILATDGDFNVGVSNSNELEDLITRKRTKGIYLTCLGFGMGNYKDAKMEVLADKGNGNYAYIDNIQEARKTLVSEFGGTLFTVAKDVKAQVEFNPAKVKGYRLVGYENRQLNAEDFKDDTKDAGDMGSGHTVTIMYEIIPVGVKNEFLKEGDGLKYQRPQLSSTSSNGELATVKFRYKAPDGNISRELIHPIADANRNLLQTSENIRFAASVAMWGMLLKDSKYKGNASLGNAILLAESARGKDAEGYRAECIRLMNTFK